MKIIFSVTCQEKCSEAAVLRCSIKKGVLRNLAKFTGKHLCKSLFLIKLQPAWGRCYPHTTKVCLGLPQAPMVEWFAKIAGNFSCELFLWKAY